MRDVCFGCDHKNKDSQEQPCKYCIGSMYERKEQSQQHAPPQVVRTVDEGEAAQILTMVRDMVKTRKFSNDAISEFIDKFFESAEAESLTGRSCLEGKEPTPFNWNEDEVAKRRRTCFFCRYAEGKHKRCKKCIRDFEETRVFTKFEPMV